MDTVSYIELVEKLPAKFECSICGLLLQDPVQSFDGASSCKRCFKSQIGTAGDGTGYFNDKAKQREMKSLRCYCRNKLIGCEWIGEILNLQGHLIKCTFTAQRCRFCSKDIPKEEVFEHMNICTELVKAGECTFANSGCQFQTEDAKEMRKHMIENVAMHLQLQVSYTKQLVDEKEDNKKQLAQLVDSKHQLELTFATGMTEMMQQITSMKDEMKKEIQSLKTQTEQQKQDVFTSASNLPAVKGGTSKLSKELGKIVQNNTMRLKNLELTSQLQENATKDGTMLWKVDKYRERRNQAVTGKITALHSAPCYVGNYGYKFCGRVYLNGDGMGKGTHLSLFIVIMKSEYDNLLQWPFTKMIRLTLFNQKDQELTIVDRLKPQKASASFQKPVKEMNIATGCPMFISIERLEKEGFVMDDCLFVEIKVEE